MLQEVWQVSTFFRVLSDLYHFLMTEADKEFWKTQLQSTSQHLLLKVNNGETKTMYEICSKWTAKTPEQIHDVIQVSLYSFLNRFHTLFLRFRCWLWTSKCWIGNRFCREIWPALTKYNKINKINIATSKNFV